MENEKKKELFEEFCKQFYKNAPAIFTQSYIKNGLEIAFTAGIDYCNNLYKNQDCIKISYVTTGVYMEGYEGVDGIDTIKYVSDCPYEMKVKKFGYLEPQIIKIGSNDCVFCEYNKDTDKKSVLCTYLKAHKK